MESQKIKQLKELFKLSNQQARKLWKCIKRNKEKVAMYKQKYEQAKKDHDGLELLMRIPKLHREWMEEKGILDEFVEAKMMGKDATAKWLLLNNSKDEINYIIGQKSNPDQSKKDFSPALGGSSKKNHIEMVGKRM